MGVVDSVAALVGTLSDSVQVETDAKGCGLIRCAEIPPILVLLTQGGRVDAAEHFPHEPESLVVWEDQWRHKPDVIRSRIAARFGQTHRIHARQCDVVQLNKPELDVFLKAHHMHPPMGAKTKLGLKHKGNLVAAASFGKPCPIHREGRVWNSVEMIRFCNVTGSTVVGGLSKLLQHFIRTHSPEDIMTSADLDWSTGESYRRLGFRETETRATQQFWIQPESLRRFYAHEEGEMLEASDLTEMDEKALMALGWTHIQNRGSSKFILELL